ncbi:hypothetical protein RhiirA5_421428 [Rhizophagus irregularis]|uniref:Uncharacterized protein n=1 Tax=Rhizophagus irregularis TaxID=588596 RepID=A0A2N0PE04_9GLOM|nr:hypothetical protein RhiirA5_421428 [Rhizophagus irregularis]
MPTFPPNSSPSSKPNPIKSFYTKIYGDIDFNIKSNNNNVSSRRNSAIFRFKPSPKQISSIDNVLSSPSGEVDISLLATTSPDSIYNLINIILMNGKKFKINICWVSESAILPKMRS